MFNPLAQFDIFLIINLNVLNCFIVTLNNLNLVVFSLAVFFILTFYFLVEKIKIIPNKIQCIFENIFLFIYWLVFYQVGLKGMSYFP